MELEGVIVGLREKYAQASRSKTRLTSGRALLRFETIPNVYGLIFDLTFSLDLALNRAQDDAKENEVKAGLEKQKVTRASGLRAFLFKKWD